MFGLVIVCFLGVLASVACRSVEFVGADDLAMEACNRWARSLEGDRNREESLRLFRSAVLSAKEAAELKAKYAPLAKALEQMLDGIEKKNPDQMMVASGKATDECNEVPGIKKQIEEELEKSS